MRIIAPRSSLHQLTTETRTLLLKIMIESIELIHLILQKRRIGFDWHICVTHIRYLHSYSDGNHGIRRQKSSVRLLKSIVTNDSENKDTK